ncbi:lipoprotein LppV [Mycobacteroides abscessus subsp. bolletii]|uniref:LppA family lipoprotein n=1 Tax=Mycobacteroides abscessus TaxID=36809 RepID=UPI0009A7316E|nr:LppA family lipoprotein [Mycobacteroides abscessus]SLI42299.1 lipoprotein LppV [Mycobacteroides abscessus subsp. bolletii]
MNDRYQRTSPTEATKAEATLASLPSLEETKEQVQNAINEIISTASNLNPEISWRQSNNADSGGCLPPYDTTKGQTAFLPNSIAANANISEAQWTNIFEAAKASAAKIGATEVQVYHDSPGNHDVRYSSNTGTFIKVGYAGNLIISGSTGCRLSAHKK